jgi:hypothetical protein
MPQPSLSRAACTLAVLALLGSSAPLHAASSASSAVSDSVGTASNSLSTSLNKSSDSSKTKNVAQGDYDVVEVVALADAAGPSHVRVRLQAVADAGPTGLWYLTLPQAVWLRAALGEGQRVAATPRPYGVEFARADTKQAFYLVLADDWRRELDPRPVSM